MERYTVGAYIERHSKSFLAGNIMALGLHPRKEIVVGKGLISPNEKNSNLFAAMKSTGWKHYTVGGRSGRNANDGYWFAVYR